MTAAQKRIHAAALRLFAEKGAGEVQISDLAEAAGVARGTIYKNLNSIEELFEQVATQLNAEMDKRVALSTANEPDPPQRLANGIRYYIRRAHEEPSWGKFLVRYAISNSSLRTLWAGQLLTDLMEGINQKRYDIEQNQLASILALIGGGVLTSIALVQEGHKTWRDAGSDAAEILLRAIGLPKLEAKRIANVELPLLENLP